MRISQNQAPGLAQLEKKNNQRKCNLEDYIGRELCVFRGENLAWALALSLLALQVMRLAD